MSIKGGKRSAILQGLCGNPDIVDGDRLVDRCELVFETSEEDGRRCIGGQDRDIRFIHESLQKGAILFLSVCPVEPDPQFSQDKYGKLHAISPIQGCQYRFVAAEKTADNIGIQE